MTTALLRRKRLLAAKVETTIGTAQTLAQADAAMNIFESSIEPTTEFLPREGQGSFSPLYGTLAGSKGEVKFWTELTGGASPPLWATTFLPSCAWINTSGVFTPSSNAPGVGGVKTLTIGFFEDGLYKQLRGCMGNPVFMFRTGHPVKVEFHYTGIWDAPTDVPNLTPTYPTVQPLKFVSAGLGIGSWAPKIAELTIDGGNEVHLREDPNDASGYISAMISGRHIHGKLNPEASKVADQDSYGQWLSLAQQALAIALGTTGNGVAFAAPKLQFHKISEGDRNKIQIDEIEFQLNRSSSAGDDELSVTFT